MPFCFSQNQLENNLRACWYIDAFTKEECDLIKEQLSKKDLSDAFVGEDKIIPEIRKSKVSWHEWNKDTDWIFQKLHQYAKDANDFRWQFVLSAFSEPIQFTYYSGDGGHYDYHQDSGQGLMSIRKLSLVLLLSDESTYEGGDLELFQLENPPKKQGTLIIFPSYEMHRVTPLTSGERYSLVAWVSGPPYK